MIPANSDIYSKDFTPVIQPGKTHRMDQTENVIGGFEDRAKAVEQSIYKILNTERYQYVIYSWDYGVELLNLMGEPVSYVCPELERRIREALLQDDRIEAVDSFTFDTSTKHKVVTAFTVHSIYGDIQAEKEVRI